MLTSTLADLTAAKLIAYYPPPTPGAILVQPSTDPSVYVDDPSYIKHLNEQSYQRYAVDVPNQWNANRFAFAAKQWEANKSATSIPRPSYVAFDAPGFDRWWDMLQATYAPGSPTQGENAPPLFFVKPAPLPPDPVIVEAGTVPQPKPATDGPIGAAVPNNPGVFNSAAGDNYPDGYVYAGQTRIIWIALQTFPGV